MEDLAAIASSCDDAIRRARNRLVHAVRAASAAGMTQTQIAQAIGRSQPEVSRLLRFHGTSALSRTLHAHRREVTAAVKKGGGRDVRVFGSVATESDGPDSDIDLLFTPTRAFSLMSLGRLENEISGILGAPVDLVPDTALMPHLKDRVLKEAVPL
ncbi:nucleotidyltransferase domain-containing protein [Brachybacterium timonense]|uniref:nucleotidyltransferase domain-containing protein n=1 Tax=Brachybacterium timonense TaxID=2050896 RepID=UPI000D0B8CAE|nr:nucleotidyltransferase domain-containing protein [Brachybacterium timonense]